LSKSTGNGLAIVDAKIGAPGTFLSFSTSPGTVAEDNSGIPDPYTRLPGIGQGVEHPDRNFQTRAVAVNKSADGRQTPWDSSSLTRLHSRPRDAGETRRREETVQEWTRAEGKPVEAASRYRRRRHGRDPMRPSPNS
jgi:hypothetical protein